MLPVDHLVYATPDLSATVREIAERFGVEPAEGGRHPGWGTRNYLLSLGPRIYLEIVGPDEDQPRPEAGRIFGIDALEDSRLVRWAAGVQGLGERPAGGIDLGAVLPGERLRPDGVRLRWRLTDPRVTPFGGVVPFLIDWMDTPHPAATIPPGGALVSLTARHPDPRAVRTALATIPYAGIAELPIHRASTPGLEAILDTPNGRVTLA